MLLQMSFSALSTVETLQGLSFSLDFLRLVDFCWFVGFVIWVFVSSGGILVLVRPPTKQQQRSQHTTTGAATTADYQKPANGGEADE